MRTLRQWVLWGGIGMATLGCRTWDRQPLPPARTPLPPAPIGQQQQFVPGPLPPNGFQPGRVVPGPGPGAIPPGPTPGEPAPQIPAPQIPAPQIPAPQIPSENRFPIVPPPEGAPGGPGAANGKFDPKWSPVEARAELGAPVPTPGKDPRVQLYPPEIDESNTKEPPVLKDNAPSGIPRFASALKNVDVGLRPALDDGLDWLQSKGYRAVLHLRGPADNEAADRKQVEKRGMKYTSLEISPEGLTRETVDQFKGMVRDQSQQPLFVYDRDGSLSGAMWYLYFRVVDEHSDEVARLRAGPLGLRQDQEDSSRELWQAIQKLFNDR